MKKIKNGFTIIELIVVIAIVGTLSTIVMVNVASYINKSKDSAVKSNLSQIAKSAKINFVENGNYNGITNLELGSSYVLQKSSSAFAAYAPLPSESGAYWCVDSTGASKQIASAPDSDVYECTAGSGGGGGVCNDNGTCNESEGENCSNCGDCNCDSMYGSGWTCSGEGCIYGSQCSSGQICQPYQSCCGSNCCSSTDESCCDEVYCYNTTMYKCCGDGNGTTCPHGDTCCGSSCCSSGYSCVNNECVYEY